MEDIAKFYEDFKSDESIIIPRVEYYTDEHGYLNKNAFIDFTAKLLKEQCSDYYLICFNVDLRLSNKESTAKGDLALRRFIASLDSYCVFRIQGEKFNALVKKDQIPQITAILEKPSDQYKVYYGIVKDRPYNPRDDFEMRDIIQSGIALMFDKKGQKTQNSDIIVGGKSNTPAELRESKRRKFCATMWYSVINLTITKPFYKDVIVYVFPTEIREPMVSMPIIVASHDKVDYNVKYGTSVTFGIEGKRFTVTCRFDRDEHLNTAIYADDQCEFDVKTHTKEGVCIPATFGKRVPCAKGIKEIYPLQKNAMGFFDYVLLDDGVITLNEDGYITTDDGVTYGVSMDETYVELIQV